MNARVLDYENKLKTIALAELQDKKLSDVFWETDSGCILFHYKAPSVSKSGKETKKWTEFALLFSYEDMMSALEEKGCSSDDFIFYIGSLIDSFDLDYSELDSPHPFGEFGIAPDGLMMDAPRYIRKNSCPDIDDYDWLDDYAYDDDFIAALAEKILSQK